MKTNTYEAWSDDGNKVALSNLDHAASLLSRSILLFGDGTQREFTPATLVKSEWIKDSEVNAVIEMGHVGGKDIVQATEFEGCVFFIEGDDLRLRMRAYARHNGESFPGLKYPNGRMELFCHSAQKKAVYQRLLDIVHERK
jgi:hypothetical protein